MLTYGRSPVEVSLATAELVWEAPMDLPRQDGKAPRFHWSLLVLALSLAVPSVIPDP